MSSAPERPTVELSVPPAAALEAVAGAAADWGAQWRAQPAGGRLALPVTAGIRRGVLAGEVDVEPTAAGSRLSVAVDREEWRLHSGAVFILSFGAAGALASTLWPFFPDLLAVAPFGVVLAIAAWLLVASRLRSAGPQEFLELVRWHAEEQEAEEQAAERAAD